MFAHFARLEQLTEGAEMPVLPILPVQGHEWNFMLESTEKQDSNISKPGNRKHKIRDRDISDRGGHQKTG